MDNVYEYDDHVIELRDHRIRARITPFLPEYNEYIVTLESDILREGSWEHEISFTTDPTAKTNFSQYLRLLRMVETYLADQFLETS